MTAEEEHQRRVRNRAQKNRITMMEAEREIAALDAKRARTANGKLNAALARRGCAVDARAAFMGKRGPMTKARRIASFAKWQQFEEDNQP